MQPLPSSPEAEKALLGVFLAQAHFDQSVLLSAGDFQSDRHRRIYLAIVELSEAGDSTDLQTVVGALRAKGELEKAGGASYVSGLSDGVPIGIGVRSWEKSIAESALRRRLIQSARSLSELAHNEDFGVLVDEAERLRGLLDREEADGSDGSLETIEHEYEQYANRRDELSIHFGIHDLDERTGGFELGEVVTLIARTAVGKSALAQNVIHNVLHLHPEGGVVFFSLEMPRLQAFERQLQIYAGKERSDVISAYRRGEKVQHGLGDFVPQFKNQLAIIDKCGMTLRQMERSVQSLVSLKRIKPVRLVVIDYLGYIGGGKSNAELTEKVSEIARGVKNVAKNLRAVVLLIAQTSRKAGDGSEEVTLTDARDSGAIEDTADFLLGAWRPALRAGITSEEYKKVRGEMWIRLLKARRGIQDKFRVNFEGKTMRVSTPQLIAAGVA